MKSIRQEKSCGIKSFRREIKGEGLTHLDYKKVVGLNLLDEKTRGWDEII